jgi:hypothetical protein
MLGNPRAIVLLNFASALPQACRARTRHKHKAHHRSLTLCPYPRFPFTSAIRITTRFPNARAARVIVSRVTDTFRGSAGYPLKRHALLISGMTCVFL